MGTDAKKPKVSVVIPAYNASTTIADLVEQALKALDDTYPRHEVIVVDDGSSDDTWDLVAELARRHSALRGARLSRNSGQAAALCAGISSSSGEVIVTIDADFDTHPSEIPRLVERITQGAAVVNAVRSGRDPRRGIPSRLFNSRMKRLGVDYADIGCGMVAMTRSIGEEILKHGEMRRGYRFKVLLGELAGEVDEVPVKAGPPSPSSHRMADLFLAGLEAELAVRRSVLGGFTALGLFVWILGSAIAIAAAAAALSSTSTGWTVAAWAVVVSLLGAVIYLLATGLNLVLRAQIRQNTPFFRIVETTDR